MISKWRPIGVALAGLMLVGGCSTLGPIAVLKAGSLVSEKVDSRVAWERDHVDLINKIVTALEMQGAAEFATGDIEGAVSTWMQAIELHKLAKPEFLIEKAIKKADERVP